METALITIRFLHFSAVMLGFGLALFRLYALPTIAAEAAISDAILLRWLRRLISLGFITSLLWLGLQTTLMFDDANAIAQLDKIKTVLLESSFGVAWCWHLALGVLALLALFINNTPKTITLGIGFFLASLAFTGHAMMDSGRLGLLRNLNQSMHLLSSGAWLGGLAGLTICLGKTQPVENAEKLLHRFSGIGYGCVILILATGALNTKLLITDWSSFGGTQYSLTLLIKIALVLAMLALAVFNRYILLPNNNLPRLRQCIIAEQILGFAVLAAVSLLGTLSPVSGMG